MPGMGGFLQSLIYGFGGLNIKPESLEFRNPYPPPGSSLLRMRGLKYLGTSMDLDVSASTVTLEVNVVGEHPLVLKRNDTSQVEESLDEGGNLISYYSLCC